MKKATVMILTALAAVFNSEVLSVVLLSVIFVIGMIGLLEAMKED